MRHGFPIFLFIFAILIFYSGVKIRRALDLRRWLGWALVLLIVVPVFASEILYRNGFLAAHPGLMADAFTWGTSIMLGFLATFLIYSIPVDVLSLSFFGLRKIFKAHPLNPARRAFLTHWVPAGILGASAIQTVAGYKAAVEGPEIKEVTVPMANLPKGLDGLKIAQISDLHIGSLITRDYISHVVEKVLSLNADLIVLTGDIADGTPEMLADAIEPLSHLKAPLGTYYVTGNHEYYWNVDDWISAAGDLGFVPLINENRLLKFQGEEFLLGGVTDTVAVTFDPNQKSDPHRAMGPHKSVALKILLAHRPESCFEAAKVGWDLQLSGHTHAGQFFPFSIFISLAHKYYRGLNRHKNMWVYVNTGTGYWGPPNRFAVPSEITLLKLTSA